MTKIYTELSVVTKILSGLAALVLLLQCKINLPLYKQHLSIHTHTHTHTHIRLSRSISNLTVVQCTFRNACNKQLVLLTMFFPLVNWDIDSRPNIINKQVNFSALFILRKILVNSECIHQ